MPGFIKDREKTELIIGAVVMGLALVLLITAIIVMTSCTARNPSNGENPASTTQSHSTEPTLPPLTPNPYHAGDFAYRDGYLSCLAGRYMLGVDVSSHQNDIDWEKVAGAGMEFAMIRIGYRGYSNGEIKEDTHWQKNLQGARENGLLVGVYFFSQAITIQEAVEEAQYVLQWLDGTQLDLPIVFDWEPISDTARTANMDAETLNACALAFGGQVKKAGYRAMVYFNLDTSTRLLDLRQLQQSGFDFWLAQYTDTMTYPNRIDMWQYTDGGTVPGISGNVDLDLYFTYE